MKLRAVRIDNRKRCIQFVTRSGRVLPLPFSRLQLRPTAADRIAEAWVDPELKNEGITYRLDSGAEDSVHVDAALDYNRDPPTSPRSSCTSSPSKPSSASTRRG